MKRKTLLMLIGAVALACLVTLTDTEAQRRGGRGRGRGPARAGMRGIELTDAQRERMQTIRSTTAKQMVQLRADLQIAEMELREALGKDTPSESDVKSKVAAVNKARGKILEVETNTRLKSSQVLTPEQRKQAQEMRQNRGRRGRTGFQQGRRGGRSGRGGPPFRGRRGSRGRNRTPQTPAPGGGSGE